MGKFPLVCNYAARLFGHGFDYGVGEISGIIVSSGGLLGGIGTGLVLRRFFSFLVDMAQHDGHGFWEIMTHILGGQSWPCCELIVVNCFEKGR
jgi:hypothetical protein